MMSPTSVSPAGDENAEFQTPIGTLLLMIESCEDLVYKTVLVPNPYYWGENQK